MADESCVILTFQEDTTVRIPMRPAPIRLFGFGNTQPPVDLSVTNGLVTVTIPRGTVMSFPQSQHVLVFEPGQNRPLDLAPRNGGGLTVSFPAVPGQPPRPAVQLNPDPVVVQFPLLGRPPLTIAAGCQIAVPGRPEDALEFLNPVEVRYFVPTRAAAPFPPTSAPWVNSQP